MSRSGTFNGCTVHGRKYQDNDGVTGWHATSFPKEGVHDYWVKDGEFYELSIRYAGHMTPGNVVETFGLVEDVPARERKAVLSAIEHWDNPAQSSLNL
jgi:hypothetical protein